MDIVKEGGTPTLPSSQPLSEEQQQGTTTIQEAPSSSSILSPSHSGKESSERQTDTPPEQPKQPSKKRKRNEESRDFIYKFFQRRQEDGAYVCAIPGCSSGSPVKCGINPARSLFWHFMYEHPKDLLQHIRSQKMTFEILSQERLKALKQEKAPKSHQTYGGIINPCLKLLSEEEFKAINLLCKATVQKTSGTSTPPTLERMQKEEEDRITFEKSVLSDEECNKIVTHFQLIQEKNPKRKGNKQKTPPKQEKIEVEGGCWAVFKNEEVKQFEEFYKLVKELMDARGEEFFCGYMEMTGSQMQHLDIPGLQPGVRTNILPLNPQNGTCLYPKWNILPDHIKNLLVLSPSYYFKRLCVGDRWAPGGANSTSGFQVDAGDLLSFPSHTIHHAPSCPPGEKRKFLFWYSVPYNQPFPDKDAIFHSLGVAETVLGNCCTMTKDRQHDNLSVELNTFLHSARPWVCVNSDTKEIWWAEFCQTLLSKLEEKSNEFNLCPPLTMFTEEEEEE